MKEHYYHLKKGFKLQLLAQYPKKKKKKKKKDSQAPTLIEKCVNTLVDLKSCETHLNEVQKLRSTKRARYCQQQLHCQNTKDDFMRIKWDYIDTIYLYIINTYMVYFFF